MRMMLNVMSNIRNYSTVTAELKETAVQMGVTVTGSVTIQTPAGEVIATYGAGCTTGAMGVYLYAKPEVFSALLG